MLTEAEKKGCRSLLRRLESKELLSLVATITNRQIATSSRDEAVRAIISYTLKPSELLRRRKVKRDLLFQYLYDEKVTVQPKAEKYVLISKILELWGSKPLDDEELMDVEDEGVSSNINKETVPDNSTKVILHKSDITEYSDHQSTAQINVDFQMAMEFSKWFYEMLNSFHSTSQISSSQNYGPQHFYQDCQMKLLCVGPQPRQETFVGADLVARRMLAFIMEEKIKFNPNLDPAGLRGKSNPHGLFIIMSCGTVHQEGNVLGIFEQQFGLVKDPDMDQNWRIKFTNLKLGSSQSSQTPTLSSAAQDLAIEA